jgi:hypothetical protein
MENSWAIVLIVFGLLAWAGQGTGRSTPKAAEKLSPEGMFTPFQADSPPVWQHRQR